MPSSWTDNMPSEHVRCLAAITCLGVKYRAEGVMTITAPTGAAPHSTGVYSCAGPDHLLDWEEQQVAASIYRQLRLRLLAPSRFGHGQQR